MSTAINAIVALALVSFGAVLGIGLMAMLKGAALEDDRREQYRAGYAHGERHGYLTGWRAGRLAFSGRRGVTKSEEVA